MYGQRRRYNLTLSTAAIFVSFALPLSPYELRITFNVISFYVSLSFNGSLTLFSLLVNYTEVYN